MTKFSKIFLYESKDLKSEILFSLLQFIDFMSRVLDDIYKFS